MLKIEKIITAVLVSVLIASFSIYGVWEDKMTFLAPLAMLIYVALAVWAGRQLCCRQKRDEDRDQRAGDIPFSGFRFQVSSFQTPPGGTWLLLFWLYSALMIPFSVIPYDAKISTLRFGCYLGTYWAAANLFSRFSRRRAVWTTVFVALILAALYSLVQHRVAPNIIFGAERYASYWEHGRLGGCYQCPNHIAHLYQMWLPFCAVFLFLPQFGWFWRICFGYALPLFSLLIYQTQSRAGLLGTVAALTATALLTTLRKSRKAFVLALIVVPLLGAGALGGLWLGSSMFRGRMQPVVKVASAFLSGDVESAIAVDFRPQTWADALVMIKERPLFGCGPGNYELVFPEYRRRVVANRILTVHPHNEPIELVAEYGLVGAFLFLCALGSLIVALVRLVKTSGRLYHALPAVALLGALAGSFVHGLFDFELRIFPNAMMLALLAGSVVAPLLVQKTDDGRLRTEGERETVDGRQMTAG